MNLDSGIIIFLLSLVISGLVWSNRQASRIQALEAQVATLLADIHEFKAASSGFRDAVNRIDIKLATISEQLTGLFARMKNL